MYWSIVGRVISVGVFSPHGGSWIKVAAYEGVCGGLLALALAWEWVVARRSERKGKTT
jgi:hypothetical protein